MKKHLKYLFFLAMIFYWSIYNLKAKIKKKKNKKIKN